MTLRRTCLGILVSVMLLAAAAAWAGAKDEITAGNAAAQAGRFKQAVKHYGKAISSKTLSRTNLAVAYNNRGSAKDDSGDADGALRDFNQAVKIKPDYAEAYYNRSFAYERKGLIRLAIHDIEKAVRLQPDDAYYRDRLEYLNSKLGTGR